MGTVGRVMVVAGVVLIVTGGLFMLLSRNGVQSMPGDISFGRGNFRFFIPLGTSIVVSIVLTLALILFQKLR